jgi:hypothetical protein
MQYAKIFPKLRTVWAYSGSAPGPGSGATAHQAAWQQATSGRQTGVSAAAARLKRQGVRKAENISARSMDEETRAALVELDRALGTVNDSYPMFEAFFDGTREVQSSQTGPLRDFYGAVHGLLQRPDLPQENRRRMEDLRDKTIRLLFYSSLVRAKFAATYAGEIAAGYQAVGLPAPNYATLSRGQAVAAVGEFQSRAWSVPSSPAIQALLQRLDGLYYLTPEVIPQEWI